MSEKVEKLIEEVKSLTVLELSELVKALEEEFGVSAAAPVQVTAFLLLLSVQVTDLPQLLPVPLTDLPLTVLPLDCLL